MYDPLTGRFLSRDPNGFNGGINLFAYVLNSPLASVDPYGLDPPIYVPIPPGRKPRHPHQPTNPQAPGWPPPTNPFPDPPVTPHPLPPEAKCFAAIVVPIAVAEPTPCGEVVTVVSIVIICAIVVESQYKCCVYRDGQKYTTLAVNPCAGWKGTPDNTFFSSYPGICEIPWPNQSGDELLRRD